jgi:hypothetical protein
VHDVTPPQGGDAGAVKPVKVAFAADEGEEPRKWPMAPCAGHLCRVALPHPWS